MYQTVKFESLSPFPVSTNFLELMRDISEPIIENKEVSKKLNSITNLRRLRKHHFDYFNKVFDNIHKTFFRMIKIDSIDEGLLMECLELIKEVFSTEKSYFSDDIGDWMRLIVPILLKFTQKQNLSFISHDILNNIANNWVLSDTLETFIDEIIRSENEGIMDFAANYLLMNIESFDETGIENSVYWDNCLSKFVQIYENSSEKWQNFIRKLLMYVSSKLVQKSIENIIDEYLTDEETNEKIRRILVESKRFQENSVELK